MPKPMALNILNNPFMDLWDYTTSVNLAALPSNGYAATRWKTIVSGAVTGTLSKVTSSSSTLIPKWIRATNTMQIDVTALPTGANVTVRQSVEAGQRFSRGFAALTVIADGPAGATFDIAVGGEVRTVTTRGADIPITAQGTMFIPDLATEFLTVDIFTNPSQVGTFRVYAVCMSVGDANIGGQGIFIPDPQTDRRLCNRYCQPLAGGISGAAASASSLPVPVRFLVQMRANPTLVAPATALTALAMSDGATVSNAAPVLTLGGVSVNAARLASTGWTGLTAGSSYMISTPTIGVLHADY